MGNSKLLRSHGLTHFLILWCLVWGEMTSTVAVLAAGEYNILFEQTELYISILFILTLLLSSTAINHQTHIKHTLSVKSSASRPCIAQVVS